MKKQNIVTIILIGIIISMFFIISNMKNENIKRQETVKEQLGETTKKTYVGISTHLSEISEYDNRIKTLRTEFNNLKSEYSTLKDGVGKIVSAINNKAESSLTNESSPDDIVNVINNITSQDYIIENIKTYVNATGSSTNRVKNTFVNYTFEKAARVKITFAASCTTNSYGTSTSALIIGGETLIYHNGYNLNYGSKDIFMDIEAGTNVTAYTIFNQTDYYSYASCVIVGFDQV